MADLGWNLLEIANATDGRLAGPGEVCIDRVVIDSRGDVRGALFVALRGEHFDGHDFVRAVAERGAAAVITEHRIEGLSVPTVMVHDSLVALQVLGHKRRGEFKGKVAAITGSSGKTTTRTMLTAIAAERYATHAPTKNFNNHVGVPLTLLALEKRHEALVLELGCSDFGEISLLRRISDPDVALVTNVGPAHLERLGDLDGVARAKGEIFVGLRSEAIAVVNLDDPLVRQMAISARGRLSYSSQEGGDVRLLERRPNGPAGQLIVLAVHGEHREIALGLVGRHNALDALAAAAAATAMGLDLDAITTGLGKVEAQPGRLRLLLGPHGSTLIEDTYNANPASMGAALEVLEEMALNGPRVAVLGDMLELGAMSESSHRELGRLVAQLGIEHLITAGTRGAWIAEAACEAGMARGRVQITADSASAGDAARQIVTSAAHVVLCKGSRGMRMEDAVAVILGVKEA